MTTDATTTFDIGGDLTVNRLGYGAMQLPGPGVWGPSEDHDGALAVLRCAVELGVDFIDTANSYGPYVADELIAEALAPYDDVTIATKAGLVRTGPGEWHPVGRPEYLRQEAELTLRRLGVERLDLFQLHRIDPAVPREEQFGVLGDLRDEGKVRHIGLSEVSVEELNAAREQIPVATVQNRFNLIERASEDVLDRCTELGIGFIPWFPIATGRLAEPGGPVDHVVRDVGASPAQVALAWLLQRSPVVLPIPGTKSIDHLKDNMRAASVTLSPTQVAALDAVA
ncbi:MAG: aldo/keto reductase [Candidatus Microthrix parvicella]|jgi:pyridoxine 4-dehydrogenase|uniref:Putative aldo/keto reductase, NAD(P)-binding n=1 Tax=Candidatus Neomicrothrix parvicella RN1 TaxID=1229780 RepID=R4Z0D6_9ACTN|nr:MULTISPECIES: aldo/keto reductase [Microthrix]MBK6501281.1 aldo/keto reductase [Candidatus Microthrix sp.]CCM62092.1 putative aldo/keto reductase, NAD(P)-binding [Candidatus Microthrix parvicella RN1]